MTYKPDMDLVLQLIEAAGQNPPPGDLFLPAAEKIDQLEDEIARMRARITDWEYGLDHLKHMVAVRPDGPDKLAAAWAITEIKRLRAVLKEQLKQFNK